MIAIVTVNYRNEASMLRAQNYLVMFLGKEVVSLAKLCDVDQQRAASMR